ncbi:MAG: crotonase/enoyl-CoA hydratase family protein [Acidimicrobiales bacterium]
MADATPVAVEMTGDVAVIRIDDGKANALSPALIDEFVTALASTAAGPGAVVIAGRPGRFSAGFDLSVMTSGADAARSLLRDGTGLLLAMYSHPRPVVVAATGHALAAGALMLLAADLRIGAEGDFKIGLNEHAIGMPLPAFALELAADRLSRRHLTRATALAEIYDPAGAVDAGYLDETAADPVAEAITRATTISETIDMTAFAGTRARMRSALVDRVRAGLEEDLAKFSLSG